MKRKIIALALTVFCAFCALGFTACKPERVNDDAGFSYAEIKSGDTVEGYEVTGLVDTERTELTLPFSYKDKPVLSIAEKAFYECETITSVVIPQTVISIGKNSFADCISLESVTIGEGVTEIGESAFYNCQALKEMVIPDGVESIGELCFADCFSLESVTIGKGLTDIEGYTFSGCMSLKEVEIPSTVKTIGECAFVSCSGLKKVTLNNGLTSIGDCAFGGCSSLKSFTMPDSVTSIGWGLLMFGGGAGFVVGDPTNCLENIIMSDRLTEIPDFAFNNCIIKSINIGIHVKKICYSAFYGCERLESVVVPDSVTEITSYAFYRCSSLKTVYYRGSAEEWSRIKIGKNGNAISSATVYYYSETQPTEEGNFWHRVNGSPVKW